MLFSTRTCARSARHCGLVVLAVLVGCKSPSASEIRHEEPPPPSAVSSLASAEPSASPGAMRKPEEPTPAPSASAAEPEEKRIRSPSNRFEVVVQDGSQLWLHERDQRPRKLVDGARMKIENARANLPPLDAPGIFGPSFSPDEKRVYFMRSGWVTSSALFYVEIDTGKVFFFHDSNGYEVIMQCSNKAHVGRVINFEHSYFDIFPSSAADLYFLLDAATPQPSQIRTGSSGRLGPIGFEEHNVARFMGTVCGVGTAPPAPEPEVVPPKLSVPRLRCGDITLRRDDLKFLDGTTLVRFRAHLPDAKIPEMFSLQMARDQCKVD